MIKVDVKNKRVSAGKVIVGYWNIVPQFGVVAHTHLKYGHMTQGSNSKPFGPLGRYGSEDDAMKAIVKYTVKWFKDAGVKNVSTCVIKRGGGQYD